MKNIYEVSFIDTEGDAINYLYKRDKSVSEVVEECKSSCFFKKQGVLIEIRVANINEALLAEATDCYEQFDDIVTFNEILWAIIEANDKNIINQKPIIISGGYHD